MGVKNRFDTCFASSTFWCWDDAHIIVSNQTFCAISKQKLEAVIICDLAGFGLHSAHVAWSQHPPAFPTLPSSDSRSRKWAEFEMPNAVPSKIQTGWLGLATTTV